MSVHRPSEHPARPRLGQRLGSAPTSPDRHPGRARRSVLTALAVVGAATLLAACGNPWTAPESTVREPTTTTPALTPVPGGGGSLTVTNPLAYQTQSPGRAVPAQNTSGNSGQGSHQVNHNYY